MKLDNDRNELNYDINRHIFHEFEQFFMLKTTLTRNHEEKKEFVYVSMEYLTFIVSNKKYKIELTAAQLYGKLSHDSEFDKMKDSKIKLFKN